MKKKLVYLDNGSTTQLDPNILKVMERYFVEDYGNASSLHKLGIEARRAIEDARKIITNSINASADEIFFTSGGTESNNLALKGIAFSNSKKGNHIITTKVEHKSILETCKWLEKEGFKITYLNVDREGFVNLEELKKAINEKTILTSIIHGNNEIGTINDLDEIAKICQSKEVYFHTDACQSFTKVKINVARTKVDLISLNAHKIHGPKGVGALYVRAGTKLEGWQHGGHQERGLRAGTENVAGIVGFAEAVKLAFNVEHVQRMKELRDKLIERVLKIPNVRLNGSSGEKRLCNNVNFSFNFVEGESIVGLLDFEGVCASTGSACAEHTLDPSHVLKAIGLKHEEMNGSLRLTLSRFNTKQDIDYVLKVLPKIIERLRKISPFKASFKVEEKNVLARSN